MMRIESIIFIREEIAGVTSRWSKDSGGRCSEAGTGHDAYLMVGACLRKGAIIRTRMSPTRRQSVAEILRSGPVTVLNVARRVGALRKVPPRRSYPRKLEGKESTHHPPAGVQCLRVWVSRQEQAKHTFPLPSLRERAGSRT